MPFKLKMQAEQKLIDIYVSATTVFYCNLPLSNNFFLCCVKNLTLLFIDGGSVCLTLNSKWKQVSHTKIFQNNSYIKVAALFQTKDNDYD